MASRLTYTESNDGSSVHHICRLCLSKESLANIFTADNFHQWISDYLSIMISPDDGMSHAVCSNCRGRLAEFHLFRVNSQKMQEILPSLIRSSDQQTESEQNRRNANDKFEDYESHIVSIKVESDLADSLYYNEQDHNIGIQGESTKDEPHIGTEDMIVEEVNDYDAMEANITEKSAASDSQTQYDICTNLVELMFDVDHDSDNQNCVPPSETAKNLASVKNAPAPKRKNRKKPPKKRKYVERPKGKPYCKRVHRCDICSAEFSSQMKLLIHHKKHTQSFVCSVCKEVFAEESMLQRHERVHLSTDGRSTRRHGEKKPQEKPFKCEKCSKAYFDKTLLKMHVESAHGPLAHECHLCGLRYAKRYILQKHLWGHTVNHEKKEDFQKLQALSKSILETANGTSQDSKDKNEAQEEMECGECHQMFQRRGLMMHFKKVHLSSIKNASRNAALAKIKALKDKESDTTEEASINEGTHAPDIDNPEQPQQIE